MEQVLTLPPRDPEIQRLIDEWLDAARPVRWLGHYRPFGHLALTIGIPGSAMAFSAAHLGAVGPIAGPLVGAGIFLTANVVEWWLHKYALHRRLSKLLRATVFGREFRVTAFDVLDEEHRGKHHVAFRWEDMVIRPRPEHRYAEWQLVLIPTRGVLGAVLLAGGLSAVIGAVSAPLGHLSLFVLSFYVLSYELLHLAHHSAWVEAPQGPVATIAARGLRVLREHHARHHEPRLQQEYNMNVTLPFADWLFKSFAPKELLAKIRMQWKSRQRSLSN